MPNPKLETKKDVEVKDCAKDILNSFWGVEILDLYEPIYHLDWFIDKGSSRAPVFAEFKARYMHSEKFPSIFLSMHKFNKMVEFNNNVGAIGLFVVWCADRLMYAKIVPDEQVFSRLPTVSIGGRHDRGISGDVEPMLSIPVEKFKTIHLGGPTNDIYLQRKHKPQKT
jgi:hypothetical protein